MSNEEWKRGYDAGFTAGWKAAKTDKDMKYINFPPGYYGGYKPGQVGTYRFASATTNDTDKKINNLTDHTLIV